AMRLERISKTPADCGRRALGASRRTAGSRSPVEPLRASLRFRACTAIHLRSLGLVSRWLLRCALVVERDGEGGMGDDCVPEAVVLGDIAEDAFEPGICPAPAHPKGLAEDAELGLDGVRRERGQLDVIGEVLVRHRVDGRVPGLVEVRATLIVVPVT